MRVFPRLLVLDLLLEVRQRGLDGGVEALDVDLLQEPTPLQGRVLDRRPPDGARVVDQRVQSAVRLDSPGDERRDRRRVAHVDGQCRGFPAGLLDLPRHRVDGGVWRVGVWRKGDG